MGADCEGKTSASGKSIEVAGMVGSVDYLRGEKEVDPVSSQPVSFHDILLTSSAGTATSWCSSAGGASASSTMAFTISSGCATLSTIGTVSAGSSTSFWGVAASSTATASSTWICSGSGDGMTGSI